MWVYILFVNNCFLFESFPIKYTPKSRSNSDTNLFFKWTLRAAEELCRRAETAAAGDGAALMILTLGFTVPSHDHFTTSFCCLLIFIVLSDINIMVAFWNVYFHSPYLTKVLREETTPMLGSVSVIPIHGQTCWSELSPVVVIACLYINI